jgi:hypothetical protein
MSEMGSYVTSDPELDDDARRKAKWDDQSNQGDSQPEHGQPTQPATDPERTGSPDYEPGQPAPDQPAAPVHPAPGQPVSPPSTDGMHTHTGPALNTGQIYEGNPANRPARNAGKPEWVNYAVSCGMSRETAEAASRNALAEQFGG